MSKALKIADAANNCSFLTFYGSQLGQAESIADNIAQQAQDYEFKTQVFPLNDVRDIEELSKLSCPVVIIASTTGDGEPPENTDRFWRKIRKKNLKPETLKGLQYTILGLGDTNYNQFCNCGKEIHTRFQGLGANTFFPPGWADDAVGLEIVVDDWIDNIWEALQLLIRPESVGKMSKPKTEGGLQLPICPPASLVLEYVKHSKLPLVDLEDPIQPYPLVEGLPVKANIANAKFLTKPGAVKTAIEITVKFQSLKFDFEPGDAVGLVCPNSEDEVNLLIERLKITDTADLSIILNVKEGAKGRIPAFFSPGCSIRQCFTYYFDIRTPPKKNFLRLLAEYTSEESEKAKLLELSSRQGASLFESSVRFPGLSLLDILLTFSSCLPPPEILIEHLPRLIPRPYSISSSPLKDKNSFTFAFNVITFTEEEGRKYPRTGVCSGWLYEQTRPILQQSCDENNDELVKLLDEKFTKLTLTEEKSSEIVVFKRKNHYFRLPENLSSPIIMVGPGTGIAPFVGFVQHRDEQKKRGASIGEMYVYFGCRHKDLDFLYSKELNGYTSEKTISKLYTSFSRDNEEIDIKYVQHYIEKNKEEVVKILCEDQGFLYVCGDAKNMAKNVREVLIKCIETIKGISEEEAKTLVTELVTSKRYLQDVWS